MHAAAACPFRVYLPASSKTVPVLAQCAEHRQVLCLSGIPASRDSVSPRVCMQMALSRMSCEAAVPEYCTSKRRRLTGKQPNWSAWPLIEIRKFQQSVRDAKEATEDRAPFTYDCKDHVLQTARATAAQMPWQLVYGWTDMTKHYNLVMNRSPVDRVSVDMLLEEMESFASHAACWHTEQMRPKALDAVRESTRLLHKGDWGQAIEQKNLAIEIFTAAHDWVNASEQIERAANIHFAVLNFDAAEALGRRMLHFEMQWFVRNTALAIVKRAAQRRSRELHFGASVRIHSAKHRPDIIGKVGEIRGRPGASTGELARSITMRDLYEVLVDRNLYALHEDEISLVTIVIQVSLNATPDGHLLVQGHTVNGEACAEFISNAEELTERHLHSSIAQHVGKHACNVKCIMPDASCVCHGQREGSAAYRRCLARALADGCGQRPSAR